MNFKEYYKGRVLENKEKSYTTEYENYEFLKNNKFDVNPIDIIENFLELGTLEQHMIISILQDAIYQQEILFQSCML